MKYLSWKEENILTPEGGMPSEKIISDMYARGFVFTRIGKGIMQQTRAVRIDLAQFELSSENRRILKKISTVAEGTEGIHYSKNENVAKNDQKLVIFDKVVEKEIALPLATTDYHWSMAKMAKDFYEKKFGAGIMSAAKIKEMLTDSKKSNFNSLLTFSDVGWAICYKNSALLHYSYPFYDLANPAMPKDMGLGMMTLAIEHAKKAGLRYIYLGSLQRPGDIYKLQFKGLEWFDGGPDGEDVWQTNIEKAREILK
jgi:arginyl-tRNA--protein-N-Asp/Glu arginylyltransferase